MPSWTGVLASHLVSVAIMLALLLRAGESPRIFIYGLFFNYLYRLLTLRGLIALHDSGTPRGRALAAALSRPPHPARPTYPVTVTDDKGTRPGGLGAYLAVLVVCAFFSFVLVNVKDQSIATPPDVIADELLAGLLAAGLWWLLDLVDRRITVRFGDPLWVNFGYNSSETTLLAVTVLTGGVASGVLGTPWPYFLVLVAFKTWFDVWDESKYPRGAHRAAEGAISPD
jgi:hypothetical protein